MKNEYAEKYSKLLKEKFKVEEEYIALLEDYNKLKQENLELIKKIKTLNNRPGRPKKNVDEEYSKIKKYQAEEKTIKEIAELLGCSERRIYRILEVKKNVR